VAELRRFMRIAKDYRLEYGPFPFSGPDDELKTSRIRNIGAGGLMFESTEPLPKGRQLLLKIFINGWRPSGEELVESSDPGSEAMVTAIAQVLRCDPGAESGSFLVGVEFLGRILPQD